MFSVYVCTSDIHLKRVPEVGPHQLKVATPSVKHRLSVLLRKVFRCQTLHD